LTDGYNSNGGSSTNLGGAFTNDTGLSGQQVFTGEFQFTVKEIEIFAIGP
jgi:hypothetical protein